jgi:plastocyanin
MKRASVAVIALALVGTSCAGGSQTRTVLIDYRHDEYASAFLNYFPNHVEAHPGDTVVFHQAWSGEPHSVTMGTVVDNYGKLMKPYLKIFAEKGYAGLPDEPPKKVAKFEKNLPWMTGDSGKVAQNGAQPCFLRKGSPPSKPGTACTKAQHRQPEFNGTYSYYNSGFIPYEGENGDTYTLKLSKDIKPGEHFFYCNYHGPFMSGFLQVKPPSEKLASAGDVAKRASREIAVDGRPLLKDFRDLQKGRYQPPKSELAEIEKLGLTRRSGGKTYFKGWLAGFGSDEIDTALLNEFIPKRVTAHVGEKLRWLVLGSHTISFNVPKYFPVISVDKNGKVAFNPKIKPSFGGAPDPSGRGHEEHQPGVIAVDAPAWDGKGFWSTGLLDAFDNPVLYSLRITKPGTYKFACLIHPPMVGTLEVS